MTDDNVASDAGRRLLGQILCESLSLDAERLAHALKLQSESGQRLGTILVELGHATGDHLAQALALQFGLPLAVGADYPVSPLLHGRVSTDFLSQANVAALRETDDSVDVAVADLVDDYAVNAIRMATGKSVNPHIGSLSDIDAANLRYRNRGDAASALEPRDDHADIQQLRDSARGEPAIKFVNDLLSHAVRLRASDVHIEPFPASVKVRVRVDGVLRDLESPNRQLGPAVVSRIKVLAGLNIAERRLPQDGRMRHPVEGRLMDMRVSTLPTMNGESVVLRLLDKESVPLDLSGLGFSDEIVGQLTGLLSRPHGIVLVTGPTGSGKTTTLYAALQMLNSTERKLLTVEDPVEYQIDGINQIQVRSSIGLGFADALRSILRHDPDVIMIGEMRDLETARIAIQSALTGHQVFSTLHTNDAAACVTRLLDMGIESYLLTATINAVVAQRLVRRLCDECKAPVQEPDGTDETSSSALGLGAVGCPACDGVGYKGRTTIGEILLIDSAIRDAILDGADAAKIREVAHQSGARTMYDDGMVKVRNGLTSAAEVARVTLGDL
jgi:general secretion pathway protein E